PADIYTLSLHDDLPIFVTLTGIDEKLINSQIANRIIKVSINAILSASQFFVLPLIKLWYSSEWLTAKINRSRINSLSSSQFGVRDRKSTRLNSSHVEIS